MAWLSPQQNARKKGREYDLDVRLRADPPRGEGRSWAGRLALTLVVLAALVGGGTALAALVRDQWLHRIPALALRNLVVSTDGVVSRPELLAVAGLKPGQNLLALDLPAVQARLLRHPRLAGAELHRELPDTLRLVVRERVPVARVRPASATGLDVWLLLDDTGHVMLPFPPGTAPAEIGQGEAALPVLQGVPPQAVAVGAAVADRQVLAALEFLARFDSSPLAALFEVLSVDVGRPGELLALTSQGSQVSLGLREGPAGFGAQLARWQVVQQLGRQRGQVLATLDLSVTNHLPARWQSLTNAAPEAAKPVRTKRRPARRHG
jgi:cell division protein FtsQ